MIIIIFSGIYGGSSTSATTAEFNSKEACLAAGKFLQSRKYPWRYGEVSVSCVPKGEVK